MMEFLCSRGGVTYRPVHAGARYVFDLNNPYHTMQLAYAKMRFDAHTWLYRGEFRRS